MHEDDLIKEIRAVREQIAAESGYDVHTLMQKLRDKEGKDGRKVVCLEARPPLTAIKR